MDCSLPGSSCPWDFPGKNTEVSCHSLLQGIFLTKGSNSGLPHCLQILYCLTHNNYFERDPLRQCTCSTSWAFTHKFEHPVVDLACSSYYCVFLILTFLSPGFLLHCYLRFCCGGWSWFLISVDHNKLRKIPKEMWIPDHLTCLLRNLYAGQEATVRTGHGQQTGSK